MTPEEVKSRTAELFHEALARTPDQQSVFLAAACGDNKELFQKVKQLLDAYAGITGSDVASTAGQNPVSFTPSPDVLLALGDRYDGIEFIGQGGMGLVFRARDREINKVVALKLLHPALAHDERVIERFRNEIRLALEITHKNVCRTYGLDRIDGTILISMEYVDGETLRSILDRVKGVSVQQGLAWSLEICEALAAAHDKKIVHRDLKPENIMIERSGHIKVMDFGIARSLEAGETSSAGTIIGTPHYMSPEQAMGKTVGPTGDIYSLGVVLYELFTGIRADPEHSILPRHVGAYLPAHLDRTIRKCVEKDPERRFQSVSELKLALTTDEPLEPREDSAVRKKYSVAVRVIVACALLATLLIGGYFALRKSMPSTIGHQDEINALAFSPDGKSLASASNDRTVVVWDIANRRRIATLADHLGPVSCVAFSSNGRWLASGSADKTIKVWDVSTGRLMHTLNDKKELVAVALSPDGRWLASTADDTVKIWDVESGGIAHTLRHRDNVQSLDFSGDGRLLASGGGGSDRSVMVWDVKTGRVVGGPLKHDDAVQVVAFSRDGNWLVSGSTDKMIRLWSTKTWEGVQTLQQGKGIEYLAFSPDGSRLISIGADDKVKIWGAPPWRELATLRLKETPVAAAISPDANDLALATTDGAIQLRALKQ